VHDWSEVRRLDREGLSRQAIARRLQMSRTTVYRLLALEEPPGLRARPEWISARPVQGRRARDAHRGWEAAFAANALAFYAAHGITVRRVSAVK